MTIFQWVIPIRLQDIAEILIFAYILYKLYTFMRGTIAVQIFLGLMALLVAQLVVSALDMTMLGSLFGIIGEVFVLAIIILFQPEIRRLLLVLGQNPLIRRFVPPSAHSQLIDNVVEAVDELSANRTGGLIAFERGIGLRNYIETGVSIQAKVTKELLIAMFYSQSPLHDGAVIIRNKRIASARSILPVSANMKLSPHLGLRHRSAVGLSEVTDAFVITISEETGQISVADAGNLRTGLSLPQLHDLLSDALSPNEEQHVDENSSMELPILESQAAISEA